MKSIVKISIFTPQILFNKYFKLSYKNIEKILSRKSPKKTISPSKAFLALIICLFSKRKKILQQ